MAHALAGGADHGYAHLVVAQFGADGVFGVDNGLAPDGGGIAELHGAVVYKDVNGLFGDAGEEHGVIAGLFQLGAEVAAGVGVVPAVCYGALGDDGVASAEECGAAVCRSGAEAQHTLGSENGSVGGHSFKQDLCAQAVSAEEVAGVLLGQLLYVVGLVRQVDEKHFSGKAVHIESFLFK